MSGTTNNSTTGQQIYIACMDRNLKDAQCNAGRRKKMASLGKISKTTKNFAKKCLRQATSLLHLML
jgi:hypothetical protein